MSRRRLEQVFITPRVKQLSGNFPRALRNINECGTAKSENWYFSEKLIENALMIDTYS